MLSTLRPFKIIEPPAPDRSRDGAVEVDGCSVLLLQKA
jgi:hypothetical protein